MRSSKMRPAWGGKPNALPSQNRAHFRRRWEIDCQNGISATRRRFLQQVGSLQQGPMTSLARGKPPLAVAVAGSVGEATVGRGAGRVGVGGGARPYLPWLVHLGCSLLFRPFA